MGKNIKLDLDNLQVQSFVTMIKADEKKKVVGLGNSILTNQCTCHTCQQDCTAHGCKPRY